MDLAAVVHELPDHRFGRVWPERDGHRVAGVLTDDEPVIHAVVAMTTVFFGQPGKAIGIPRGVY